MLACHHLVSIFVIFVLVHFYFCVVFMLSFSSQPYNAHRTSPMLQLPMVQLPTLQLPCSNVLSSNFPSSIFLCSSTFTAHHSTQPLSSPTSHCPLPTAHCRLPTPLYSETTTHPQTLLKLSNPQPISHHCSIANLYNNSMPIQFYPTPNLARNYYSYIYASCAVSWVN